MAVFKFEIDSASQRCQYQNDDKLLNKYKVYYNNKFAWL